MPNRYLCDVLEEMRKLNETRNYAMLLSLVEEAQILGNRMEAALEDKKDFRHWHDKAKKEKQAFNALRKETDKLRKQTGKKAKGELSTTYQRDSEEDD